MLHWLTERRRARLLEQPFPTEWTRTLADNVAAYALLDEAEQQRLRDLTQVFIAEKHWEGCGGLTLTDEMRVTIAGTACLLIMGRDHDLYADVESILVYPSTVATPKRERGVFDSRTTPVDSGVPILGEAWQGGPVIVAWDAVRTGSRDSADGHNVVIHEMAHKIDFVDGAADGTPPMESRAALRKYVDTCAAIFTAHREEVAEGKPGLIGAYAATHETEFFAVVTELFFEKPRALATAYPDLYAVLQDFYQLDLAK